MSSDLASSTHAAAGTVRRRVDATAEQVFDVLRDGWLYPVWVVGAARMREVDEHWPQVGSRLHHSVGLWPLMLDDVTQVLEHDPPHRLVLQAHGWPAGEARVTLVVEPDPAGGCVVALGEDVTHGPGVLVPGTIRRPAIAVRNRETLRRLALVAEGRRTGAG